MGRDRDRNKDTDRRAGQGGGKQAVTNELTVGVKEVKKILRDLCG